MSTPTAPVTPAQQRQLFLDKAKEERQLANVAADETQKANHASAAAQYEAWANDAEYCRMVSGQSAETDDDQ